MPYYQIIITLDEGKVIKGVKQNDDTRIDYVWRHYQSEAFKHYKMKDFDCFMISRQSDIYKAWILSKQMKAGMHDDYAKFEFDHLNGPNKPHKPNQSRKQMQSGSKGDWGENVKKQNEKK